MTLNDKNADVVISNKNTSVGAQCLAHVDDVSPYCIYLCISRPTYKPTPFPAAQNLPNSTHQDITDVGADTSYARIYMSNIIKTLCL